MTMTRRALSELRTPNLELRRARLAMRMSQTEFAEAVRAAGNAHGIPNQCTKRLVQKWETGEHTTCRPAYLAVLQTVTGLAARDLGFSAQDPDTGPVKPAQAGTEDPHTGADSAIDRLRYAVEHPASVNEATAGFAEAATARLYDLERHSPARLLTPTVHRHLSTVTALLEVARHRHVRDRLTTTSAESMLLGGWLAFDQGNAAQANRFWDSAISAAQSTEDGALLAAALTQQSYAAARRNDPESAWHLAYSAFTIHAPDEPRTRAWILLRMALYTAQLGELEEARTALHQALETGVALPHPRPGDSIRPWTRALTPAALHAAAAHIAALLGDTPAAAHHVTAAVKALGPARDKTRALVLAELTLTGAMIDDYDACALHGIEAAGLTRSLDASLAADLLHHSASLLLPYCTALPVRDLVAQLTQLSRTADLEDAIEREAR